MLYVKSGKLTFCVAEDGSRASWQADGLPMAAREDGDFWRMYIDDFKFRDCPVHSAKQHGKAAAIDGGVEITYDRLLDDTGREANVTLIVRITSQGEALKFDAHIENHDERFRLNEFKLPFMDMRTIASRKRSQDVLYLPNGLGQKVPNPWGFDKMTVSEAAHLEYLEPSQYEVFRRMEYPGHYSMGWFGMESGDHFLYLAQQDELFRSCDLTYGKHTRTSDPSLILEITHFPVVKYGEAEDVAPTFAALFEGDWRMGADYYRRWANQTWWTDPVTPDWMREWTGREKVILRHGNGQILHTYEEVPSIMKRALECGIPMIELYGWHSGGQDNDYPNYYPDPQQGGEEGLRKAIEEVHKMGGRISLYGQGELLVTPLQMASLFTAYVNGGDVIQPRLVKEMKRMDPDDKAIYNTVEPVAGENSNVNLLRGNIAIEGMLKEENIDYIVSIMEGVITEGTGQSLNVSDMSIAGKTGTAEIGSDKERIISWFIGFVSDDSASRLVCIVLEVPSGKGSSEKFALAREAFMHKADEGEE